MGYKFGSEQELTCIANVRLQGAAGEELCLAYKSTTYSVLAPATFTTTGTVAHEERSLRFHLTNGEQIPFFAEWSERRASAERSVIVSACGPSGLGSLRASRWRFTARVADRRRRQLPTYPHPALRRRAPPRPLRA